MVSKLVEFFTMKSMKGLNLDPLPWIRRIETSHFFNELAHGIARSFMVDSLVCRLPVSFMVRSVQSHNSVFRGAEVSANCETGHPSFSLFPNLQNLVGVLFSPGWIRSRGNR